MMAGVNSPLVFAVTCASVRSSPEAADDVLRDVHVDMVLLPQAEGDARLLERLQRVLNRIWNRAAGGDVGGDLLDVRLERLIAVVMNERAILSRLDAARLANGFVQ